MEEMKPCPFCGCGISIHKGAYPNGDEQIEPYGFHDSDCPLNEVLWCMYPEEGWTEEKIVERWNRRMQND